MEILLMSMFGFIVSAAFLKFAPMYDLKIAMHYAKLREQNERS